MIRPWTETSRRTLVATRVFELQERRTINPRNEQEVPFFVLESPPWVNVIPLTREGRVIMVRQYRVGTGTVTLEIPGGMSEPGERPEDGARRELLEETGYEAGELELLGAVDSNPAIQNNATYTFLTRAPRRVAEPDPDLAEDLEVVEVDLEEVSKLIMSGEITHSLVVAAFYWFDRYLDREARMAAAIDELARAQTEKVAALAKRINSRLTADDLLNPQDFPELAGDPDFNYQDGVLAGLESARMALGGARVPMVR